MSNFGARVQKIITKIPRGKVATYGQVATLAGSPRSALAVGRILRNSAQSLPWQRVINSQGRISIQNMEYPAVIQKELLEQEGVKTFMKNGEIFIDLEKYLWST